MCIRDRCSFSPANYGTVSWTKSGNTYSYQRSGSVINVGYHGGESYQLTDSNLTVYYSSTFDDCTSQPCGFFTFLKDNTTGEFYFLIGEDDFMPDGSAFYEDNDVRDAFENDFIPNIAQNVIGGTITYSGPTRIDTGSGLLFGASIITADNGSQKIHFVFADYMDKFLDYKGWSYNPIAGGLIGSFSASFDFCSDIYPHISPTPTPSSTSAPTPTPTPTSTPTPTPTPTCGDGVCDFPETSVKELSFECACPDDCGCNNNDICEFERGENHWNCQDDCPKADDVDCLCLDLPQHLGGAGLVPCGRRSDDLDTPNICECCPCTFCHFLLLGKRITDFLLKDIFIPLLVVFISVAGLLLIFRGGSVRMTSQGKRIAIIAGVATGILLGAWFVINTILCFLIKEKSPTSVFLSPWDELNCTVGKTCTSAKCGDGIVQKPNWEGFDEECELEEKWEGFKARAKKGKASDVDGINATTAPYGENIPGTTIDAYDYWASYCSCDEQSCKIK